jgi:CRP/FNR family cyclic AMP-dependent transcriptional regulator
MPPSRSTIAILRRSPLFREVAPADLELVLSTMRQHELTQGQRLFEQGARGEAMHVVLEGGLAVLVRDTHGRENKISQIGPGQCVGEMTFLDPQPRSASVAAMEPSVVLELDRHLLAFLRSDTPRASAAMVGGIIEQLGERLRDTNQLIEVQLRRLRAQRGAPVKQVELARHPAGPKPRPYSGAVRSEELRMLRGLTSADQRLLERLAPPRIFEDRALLCHEEDRGDSCFVVLSGQVDVLKAMRGKRRRLATLKAGSMVGQLALVEPAPRSATVRARGRVVAMELSHIDFQRQLAQASPLALRFQEQIAVSGVRQLRMANSRCVQLFDKAKHAHGRAPEAPAPEPTAKGRPSRRPSHLPRESVTIEDPLAFVQTALKEWGMSMDQLEQMEVVQADGMMTAAEIAARKQRY